MRFPIKALSIFCMAGLALTAFTSCSDDDNDNNGSDATTLSEGDQYLQKVLAENVDNTINPTYAAMALAADSLYTQVQAIHEATKTGTVTQAMVDQACKNWKSARARYEKSEAFLMGAAADYDIDPHIDTWPLDLATLCQTLNNDQLIKSYDTDDKDANAAKANSDLGQTVLGFHGVEFILFRDGQPRKAAELNGYDTYNKDGLDFTRFSGEYEMIFAEAVTGDLRNSIYRLEVCWNENAPKSHFDVLEGLEWNTKMSNSDQSYGQNMKSAGQAGSLYRSIKTACSAVIAGDGGAVGISDQSIANVWYGGVEENRGSYSFDGYFKKYNPTIATNVEQAIVNAQATIKSIPTPFVLNYTSPKCKDAIDACKALSDALSAANDYIVNSKD